MVRLSYIFSRIGSLRQINLIHPFTPKAAGVVEKSIPHYHSQPHALSLNRFATEYSDRCNLDYFTDNYFFYTINQKALIYRFFPVDFSFRGNHKKFRKQSSRKCLKAYKKELPHTTIINMSGHSSQFSFELSQLLISKGRKYIPMLGGQHFSDNLRNREFYGKADHILVHTKYLKKLMLDTKLFQDLDIRVFPLGVDINTFKPKSKINSSPNNKIKLLYVGMIVERKRIHIGIDVVKGLLSNGFHDVQFDVIGPVVSDKYLENIKRLIKKNNLNDNVNIIDQISHKSLISYYQEADLFIFPSDRETFGMVIIESMACGTPVAAIDCLGGPSEVIEHNYNGILSNLDDYTESIIKYFKDNKLKKYIVDNAIKTVVEQFSLQKTYKVLVNSIDG